MGCVCTEPRKKPSNLDILKGSGEPVTISQNEQKPDKYSNQEKHANEEISFKNCAPALQNEEVRNEFSTRLSETYSPNSRSVSDVSFGKSRKTVSLTPDTTSDDMKQSICDFNLVFERAVILEQCIPGENRSTKLQWDRAVASDVSLPDPKPLQSAKTSSAELAEARKELEHMELKNKQKDEEIRNLTAEIYRLKQNEISKAVQISLKSLSLKERHSSMRRRREEIEKNVGISHRMLPDIQNVSDQEQENELEPRISITHVPELNEISTPKQPSLHWRATPPESRPSDEIVETESKWTIFEPTVLK